MDYQVWIEKQRRHRQNILMSSAEVVEQRIYRICQDCGEVCLCGEQSCPNCDSDHIEKERFAPGPMDLAARIRCRHRFMNLELMKSHES